MHRREFIKAAAGVPLAAIRLQPATNLRTVRTPILEIAYHETGDAAGFPIILLHGFPDDAHAYAGVSPLLAKAGYRALAVYLRGYARRGFSIARSRAPPNRRRSART